MINLIRHAESYLERIAVKSDGKSYSYQQLLAASENIALNLLNGHDDIKKDHVAFLVQPGFMYTTI